jgi:hypothetical protein
MKEKSSSGAFRPGAGGGRRRGPKPSNGEEENDWRGKQSKPDDRRSRKSQVPPVKSPVMTAPRKISTESIVIGPPASGDATRISNGNLSLPRIPERLSTDSQTILDNLVEKYPFIVGSTWVPMLDITNDMNALSCSFLGGSRILLRNEITEWPICLNCRCPMVVLAQIDRASLPHTLHGKGVVQLFACVTCATSTTVPRRSVCWATSVGDVSGWTTRECPKTTNSLPFRRIVKWLPRTDYMHPQDVETETGIKLPLQEWAVLGEAQIRCDKVGGYPAWLVSGPPKKFPTCKLCDRKMRLLLLIDSMDNVPVEWGADGCIQVFECQNHPDSVVALWEHMTTDRS